MADRRDLRVNELQRFTKHSSTLVLEAHGHCEVPAGCGGVVLRWRRPGSAVEVVFLHHVAGTPVDFCIDGAPLTEPRATLAPGAHVLSFVVEQPGPRAFLMFRAEIEPPLPSAAMAKLTSRADGSWRVSLTEPDGDWRRPGFDDSRFAALVQAVLPRLPGKKNWDREELRAEATPLGLPEGSPPSPTRVWIRWRFHVDDRGFR